MDFLFVTTYELDAISEIPLMQRVEAEDNIPDQLKKPTQKPTMAWVFRLFQGIQVWLIPCGEGVKELVVNLNAITKRIISYFGATAEGIYASTG